jgi:hypothetical protein
MPASSQQSAAAPAANPQKAQELKPTKNLAGSWVLNRDESDDPRSRMRGSRGGGQGGNHPYGGGGMGGGWGGHHGGGSRQGGNDADHERMQELLRPANALTIAQKDGEFDLSDDQNRKSEIFTDGRKLEKSKDPNNQQYAAKWEDYKLVVEEKGARGGKIERAFEISTSTGQLYETVNLTMGRDNRQTTFRYVYDPASAASAPAQ